MEPYTLERLGAGMFGVQGPADPALDAPTLYGVSYLHDRPTDGLAVGYVALHLYPTDYLRFELLGKLGHDDFPSDNSTGFPPSNYLGGRRSRSSMSAGSSSGWAPNIRRSRRRRR